MIAQHSNLPPRIVHAITHHHTPDAGRDIACDVVCLSNIVAKRVGTGHVASPEDLEVDPAVLGRLTATPETVDRMAESVEERLEGVLAQYAA